MSRFSLHFLLMVVLYVPQLHAKEHILTHGEQRLIVDTHFLLLGAQEQHVVNWITRTAGAMASVFGRWPRDEWRIEVTPVTLLSEDPVPWAQVLRGEPDTISFYINALASEETLTQDWTAFHEMSHLLIPYRGWGDMWFSEGLASYYQNLLLAREDIIDAEELWKRLHAGFHRGRLDTSMANLDLEELSPQFRETGSYMRVYWSGVWFFLNADVQLRQSTNNKQSLDTALKALNECCANLRLSARQIAIKLDQLTDQDIFLPSFYRVRESHTVPDFESILRKLAVTVDADTVVFKDGGMSNIRNSIGGHP